ncbi:MAG: bifunctional (p)ppGpp synthetase/guanosine-3',5'-bis(diphosphate) 3'-pyrophosphohydrolase [Planctomycetia bacterium]|nr:bifunctional (p)ppGpp synthetase/guanosine-3',5'-bis(diphosphate) 3'-pyrophosphohydrolase [Planctomycetia bacterium]
MSPDHDEILFDAIAFAARVHRHQVRKDGQTPYVSHAYRVAMIVRHVFGFDEPKMLAASVLHDTIEDTTTDFEDLETNFGRTVAGWVAALTKDTRMPEAERERAYCEQLLAAGWQVCVCKLADIYDNLADSAKLTVGHRRRTVERSQVYLAVWSGRVPAEAKAAYNLVQNRLHAVESQLANG